MRRVAVAEEEGGRAILVDVVVVVATAGAAAGTDDAVEAGFWITSFFLVMWLAWLCGWGGVEGYTRMSKPGK